MKILMSICLILGVVSHAHSLNYFVNSTRDVADAGIDGACYTGQSVNGQLECTLRAAIQEANATAAADGIGFAISGCPGGVCTINVDGLNLGALPAIVSQLNLDAATQPGNESVCDAIASRTTYKVIIQGAGDSGLQLAAGSDGSVVSGLNIRNFSYNLSIFNSNDNQVKCNLLGTDETGMQVTDLNYWSGMLIACSSQNNVIGGMANDGNVISGNQLDGISISGAYTCNQGDNEPKNNAILGNFIGTLKDGVTAGGNRYSGISIYSGPANNNFIGSLQDGVSLNPNVIADSEVGLDIGFQIQGTKVFGNFIGTDLSGVNDIGNLYSGIRIIDSKDTQMGGGSSIYGNNIAYNREGILISGADAQGNHYSSNLIYLNETMPVDIAQGVGTEPDGLNANDTDDADTGANNVMNNVTVSAVTVIEDQMIGNYAQFDLMVDATDQNAVYPLWIEAYVAPYGSDIFELQTGSLYQNAQQQVLFMVDLQSETAMQVKFVVTDDEKNASEMSAIYHVNNPDIIFKHGFED